VTRFIKIRCEAQLDLQALHWARKRLDSEPIALINHLRALPLERGIAAPQAGANCTNSFRPSRTKMGPRH
jgi:hypothetical protein